MFMKDDGYVLRRTLEFEVECRINVQKAGG